MRVLKSVLAAVSVSGILLIGGATVAAADDLDVTPSVTTSDSVAPTTTGQASTPSTGAAVTPKAAVTPTAPTSATRKKDLDCKDFPNQAAAQAVYDADPSDPNGLDRDKDGKACESLADGRTAAAAGTTGQQQIPVKPAGGVDTGGGAEPLVQPLTALAVLGVFGTGVAAAGVALRRARRTS